MSVTGSSPCRSRSQSTSMSHQTSPTHPSSKRAFSAAASPRNIGPRGKRARRGDYPSLRASTTIASGVLDPLSAVPTPTPLTTVFTNLASSAPATPLLPSSSSAFFPAVLSSTSHNSLHIQSSSRPSPRYSRDRLDDLHREAFTSLRQSLAQSGEGFLRRMQDWEQHRNMESSKAPTLGAQERESDKRRARRHRIQHTDHRSVAGMSVSHPHDDCCLLPADISHPAKEPDNMSGYGTFTSGQDESDIEDDVLINNVGHPLSLAPPEIKSRSVSLGRPSIEDLGNQELFALELSESDAERYPSAHYTSTFDSPFTYANTRSSSPFSLGNTSDDDSSAGSRYDQPHSGFSSPRALSNSVDWPSHKFSTRNESGISLRPGESIHQSCPGASPRPSPGFPQSRLTARRHTTIQHLDDTSAHKHSRLTIVSEATNQVPQAPSDTALAALVLAFENGSGSLADYGYVREAQGELEELEAGALWE